MSLDHPAKWEYLIEDVENGFTGGQFGVQKDRVDKCAAGWDEKSELSKHQSQKGTKLHFF